MGANATLAPSEMAGKGTPAIAAAERAGIAFRVHEYEHDPARRRSARRRSRSSGSTRARVFKTLVADVDGALTVAVVPVEAQLDLRALGKRARMADPRAAERATGYVTGGISPLGQRRPLPDGRRRVGARVRDDPRERGPARARARAGAGRPARAHRRPNGGGSLPPVTDQVPVELHIVSDSTGETAARLVLALEAQFPDLAFEEVRHPRVESVDDLALAVSRARGRPAVMVYTLVEPGLRDEMRRLCRRARVHYCDLLGHPIDSISRVAGVAARMEPGARAPLDQTYFKRIEAIEFAVRYDDGIGGGLDEADIVLVGVSRTSKTPALDLPRLPRPQGGERPDRAGRRAAAARSSRSTARRSSG